MTAAEPGDMISLPSDCKVTVNQVSTVGMVAESAGRLKPLAEAHLDGKVGSWPTYLTKAYLIKPLRPSPARPVASPRHMNPTTISRSASGWSPGSSSRPSNSAGESDP